MKVKITVSNMGGELSAVIIDVCDETDPAITEAVIDIAHAGIQAGDTISINEVQES